MMTIAELKRKILNLTHDIDRTSSAYLKQVYAEQRGRYEHEIKRQHLLSKGATHGQVTKAKQVTHKRNTSIRQTGVAKARRASR